jgi:hypothetical protein
VESRYTKIVTELSREERKLSFENISLEDWFEANKDTESQAGTQMGLTVLLDAHTDHISEFTVNSDFQGFAVSVQPSADFPLMHLNEFRIKPGLSFIKMLLKQML